MTYPKNNYDFRDFVIGKVRDNGDMWEISSVCRNDKRNIPKMRVGFTLKPGFKYRVYYWHSFAEGIFVSGRNINYMQKEERINKIRQMARQRGRALAKAMMARRQINE